ncbi:MAG: tRNA-dihydrouridine synthase [Vicinamibacterales bacterium]|jgi:tRNA-dihydrouridine synthase B
MKIGTVQLDSPFVISPMAGMTDTAFRRLVKRQGGCGLVVSEMVSSEGLVRGIDRTLEYAEYTEEERPVSIQIFGGEPARMAEAARVVEAMGANIVDVNMGCPVPKISRHNAGCSLMREPGHAAEIIAAMTRAVTIPVTVKMRKGWDAGEVNAPELAKRVEGAGAAAIAVHGRTAEQSYSGSADWDVVAGIARSVSIPVFGSGDCVEPEDIVARMQSGVSGVFVGRGVLRNPWILAQAQDLMAGLPARVVTDEDRGQFLLDYMGLLLADELGEQEGFRHLVIQATRPRPVDSKERWVINKLRALCAWYSKGFEGGAQFRIGVNSAKSIAEVEALIANFFLREAGLTPSK